MKSLMQYLRFQPPSMVVIVVMQNWKKPKTKKKNPKFFDQGFYFQPKKNSERTGKFLENSVFP